jgi:drug/metabolite transporter (DMT)-like permease
LELTRRLLIGLVLCIIGVLLLLQGLVWVNQANEGEEYGVPTDITLEKNGRFLRNLGLLIGFIGLVCLVAEFVSTGGIWQQLQRGSTAGPAVAGSFCDGCGARTPVGAKFCQVCGRPMAPPSVDDDDSEE